MTTRAGVRLLPDLVGAAFIGYLRRGVRLPESVREPVPDAGRHAAVTALRAWRWQHRWEFRRGRRPGLRGHAHAAAAR